MSQPFDNRDYDVQQLAKKDAEIERLKEQNAALRALLAEVLRYLDVSVAGEEARTLCDRIEEALLKGKP
jgi:hypothetical protein